MSLVWRKLQRSNKKAAKFRFTADFQELALQCDGIYQPRLIQISWVHRRRRYTSRSYQWEPTITDPTKGIIKWMSNIQDSIDVTTTMYRDKNSTEWEDKEWTFVVEETTYKQKIRPLASVTLNLRLFVQEIPGTQTEVKLKLRPLYEHIKGSVLQLVLTSMLLREGDPNDVDLMSTSSRMSTIARGDIRPKVLISPVEEDQNQEISDNEESAEARESLKNLTKDINDWQQSTSTSKPFTPIKKDSISDVNFQKNEIITTSTPNEKSDKCIIENKTELYRDSTSFETDSSGIKKSITDNGAPDIPPHQPKPIEMNENVDDKKCNIINDVADLKTSVLPRQKPNKNCTQDLLEWCQSVTKGYNYVNISNFDKSFRNGMAFCALIDYHRPDLLNFDSCAPTDTRGNCSKAFDAAAKMGVPVTLNIDDMVIYKIPDKVAVITFVYNLRAAMTGVRQSAFIVKEVSKPIGNGANDRSSMFSLSENEKSVLSEFDRMKRDTIERESHHRIHGDKALIDKRLREEENDISACTHEPSTSEQNGRDTTKIGHIERIESARRPINPPFSPERPHDDTDSFRNLSPESRRKAELRLKARRMINEANQDVDPDIGRKPCHPETQTIIIKDSAETGLKRTNSLNRMENLMQSWTSNRSLQSKSIRRADEMPGSVGFYQFRRHHWSGERDYSAMTDVTSYLPALNIIGHSTEQLPSGEKELESAFTRMSKRYGSMNRQGIMKTLGNWSVTLGETMKSVGSVGHDLSNHNMPRQEATAAPSKLPDSTFRAAFQTIDDINEARRQLGDKLKKLNKEAEKTEKTLRELQHSGAAGSIRERNLMDEYLELVNERNLIVKREERLNILENIKEQEQANKGIQQQLMDILQIDEYDKTEADKRKIDDLMMSIKKNVDKRNELEMLLMHVDEEINEIQDICQ